MDLKSLRTHEIPKNFTQDRESPRYRIGLVALDTDLILEWDFHRALPSEVAFYTSHVHVTYPMIPENLRKMGPQLQEAVQTLLPEHHLDVVAYGCTSASIAIGYENVRNEVQKVRPEVPVVTPSEAAIRGLQRLNVRRIHLITPYLDSVNQMLRTYFEEQGIDVVRIDSFCYDKDFDTVGIPTAALVEAAISLNPPEAEATFLSCTGLRALDGLEKIEAATDKPALCSNQCILWDCLINAGFEQPLEGYGQLLKCIGQEA